MAEDGDYLRIVEIIRSIDSGATRPFQCRLEDDHLYAVKGRAALGRGLMGELYAGALGRRIGLPIPSFSLATISRQLLTSHSDTSVQGALGTGTLFASLWQEPVQGLKTPDLPNFSKRDLASLYVFDHWIENGDRSLSEHGGNANLLMRLNDRKLVVIDHNLAFMPSYRPEELLVHSCRNAWLDARRDLVFKAELEKRMRDAIAAVPQLERELPDDWLEQDPDFPAYAEETLNRIHSSKFWIDLG